MRSDPLQAAVEAIRIAVDAMQRARVYYDYMDNSVIYNTVIEVHECLVDCYSKLSSISIRQ